MLKKKLFILVRIKVVLFLVTLLFELCSTVLYYIHLLNQIEKKLIFQKYCSKLFNLFSCISVMVDFI